MGKTFRNTDYSLFGGVGDGRDGHTLSDNEGYRKHKEMRRRKERRKQKQLIQQGEEVVDGKKDDKWYW